MVVPARYPGTKATWITGTELQEYSSGAQTQLMQRMSHCGLLFSCKCLFPRSQPKLQGFQQDLTLWVLTSSIWAPRHARLSNLCLVFLSLNDLSRVSKCLTGKKLPKAGRAPDGPASAGIRSIYSSFSCQLSEHLYKDPFFPLDF